MCVCVCYQYPPNIYLFLRYLFSQCVDEIELVTQILQAKNSYHLPLALFKPRPLKASL